MIEELTMPDNVVAFPKKRRECCEMIRDADGKFSHWCTGTPSHKVFYQEMDMGGLVVGGQTITKFWCEDHAPDFAEAI
jgi:hypothetical protein